LKLERNATAEVPLVVGPILAAILLLVNLLPIPSVIQATRTAAHPLVNLLAMEQSAGLVLESVILRRYAVALLLPALPIPPLLMELHAEAHPAASNALQVNAHRVTFNARL